MQLLLEFIEESDVREGRRPPRWEKLDEGAREAAINHLSRLVALMLSEKSLRREANDE
jgi:hypothetical protein